MEQLGAVFEGDKLEKVAPQELEDHALCALAGAVLGLVLFDFVVQVARRQASVREPNGEFR